MCNLPTPVPYSVTTPWCTRACHNMHPQSGPTTNTVNSAFSRRRTSTHVQGGNLQTCGTVTGEHERVTPRCLESGGLTEWVCLCKRSAGEAPKQATSTPSTRALVARVTVGDERFIRPKTTSDTNVARRCFQNAPAPVSPSLWSVHVHVHSVHHCGVHTTVCTVPVTVPPGV